MNEKPITFLPAMVSAILAERKFQTRRILKDEDKLPWRVGDCLYVREAHYRFGWWEPQMPGLAAGAKKHWRFEGADECAFDPPRLPFNARPASAPPRDDAEKARPGWYRKPPMFMPKRWARIRLQVTEVSVERLQTISPMSAEEEGLAAVSKDGKLRKWGIPDRDGMPGTDNEGWPWAEWRTDPRSAFAHLWGRVHGPGAWAANPMVAAIVFKVTERPA